MDYSALYCNHHSLSNCQCCTFTQALMSGETFPYLRNYKACVQAAFEFGAIKLKGHVSDLITHDREELTGTDPALPFAFCVRENGTHLVKLTTHDGVGHMCWDHPKMVGDAFASNPTQWYWWDGETMKALKSYKDAEQLLRDECEKRGIDYWSVRKP